MVPVHWHPVISDADGYDILATRDPHILRVQVKATLEPQKDKARSNRKSWKWTVGLGRRKDILIPTDHYDVLALVALEPNVIQFVNANAAFERALNGRCFCPPGKHYSNCKAAKNINRIVCRLS